MFRDMMSDALSRSQAFADQLATIERDALARADTAVAAWAQLAEDAISLQRAALGRARKLGLEAASHMGRMGRTGTSA